MCLRSGVSQFLQYKAHFLKFYSKDKAKGVSITCVATFQIRHQEFISPIPTFIYISHIFTLNIIFPILWLSLNMDNFTMTRFWLISRSGTDTIVHFCLSISDQLCCKIMLVCFWFHLNARPNCVVVQNLSRTYVLHDNTTNHNYYCIVVLHNPPKTNFIGPVKDSCRCVISYLLPSKWTGHYVYTICTCTGLSMVFQDEYLTGSMLNYFPIPSLSWLVCIHPYLMQKQFQGGCDLGSSMLCHKSKDDRL